MSIRDSRPDGSQTIVGPASAANRPARTRSQSARCSGPTPQHGAGRRVSRDADGVPAVSYPRRQALRRRLYATVRAIEAAAALAAALMLMAADVAPLAAVLCLAGVTLLIDGAGAAREARRSSVGADSEARVRRELARLRREGWHVRHGVSWPCGGDVDHVVRTPDGFGFAIETKTRRYDRGQLERTAATARWLARRRRRYPRGVVPVLCVVRARRAPVIEHGVLVVSIDGLVSVLSAEHELGTQPPRRSLVTRRAFGGRAAARW